MKFSDEESVVNQDLDPHPIDFFTTPSTPSKWFAKQTQGSPPQPPFLEFQLLCIYAFILQWIQIMTFSVRMGKVFGRDERWSDSRRFRCRRANVDKERRKRGKDRQHGVSRWNHG